MYLAYLYMTYGQGVWKASGGRGATAVLVGFSAAVMTLSKTVLYCELADPPVFLYESVSFFFADSRARGK